MADKRINALANTAPSTASDDFIAVDGTTNGTRKLNAFSPTFGGNATVTGTLTANSAITGPTLAPGVNTAAHYFTAYGATTSWPLRLSTIYDSNYVDQYLTLNGTLTGSRATPTFTGAAVGGSFIRSNGENSVLSVGTFVSGAGAAINTVAVFNPTNVTIPQTTASTTTSTGALVVGNGTSGGLGVGGNITVGGQVDLNAGTAAAPSLKLNGTNNGIYYTGSNIVRIAANATEAATFSATAATVAGTLTASGATGTFGSSASSGTSLKVISGVGTLASPKYSTLDFRNYNDLKSGAYIRTGNRESDTNEWLLEIATRSNADVLTSIATFSDTKLSILSSTASTTTSSGALVVSGGVGVAGAIVTGGIVRCGGTNGLSLGSDTGNIRIDSAGPAGVEFRGLSAADTISGFTMREMALIDGTSAPSTRAGYATIYVDSADGDLKVKFGDGTVKTIATDS